MSFTVKLWSFNKKFNSTDRPSNDNATSYDCIVKDGTKINRPIIELNLGFTSDPSTYNYAQISAFDRYYFIDEWSFDNGLWTASMHTDVLATFKSQIGNSTLYVLRAAGASDGRIVDHLYPCKVNCDFNETSITTPYKPYYDNNGYQGCYILGVVADIGSYGSLKYYVLDQTGMAAVCNYLINDAVSLANGFELSDAALALQNSIVDPIQYIKSAMWLPFAAADISGVSTSNVKVFNWTIPSVSGHFLSSSPYIEKTFTVNTKKHPDASSRGAYVNSTPYTLAHLSFPPFGVIEIDTSVICDVSSISLNLKVDGITGRGFLEVLAHGQVLNRLEAQIGVPIQLAQISSDYLGAASSIAGGVSSSIGSFVSGNIGGGIASALSGLGNAVEALAQRAQTIGSGGAFSHLLGSFELGFQFFRPVADDNTHHGRPLCQNRQINTLSGFMLIQDGDIGTVGFVEENQEIKTLLESGFYYE